MRGLMAGVLILNLSAATFGGVVPQAPQSASQQVPPQGKTPSSEEPTAESEPALVLKSTTRLVVVDVIASGSHGNAITDLKQADFTVLEDGRPQDVKVFAFQQPPANSPVSSPAPALPPNTFTNVPSATPTGVPSVIVLDALNTQWEMQAKARLAALKALDRLPSNCPIAVYVLSTKVRLLQGFTTDRSVVREALRKYTGEQSPLLADPVGSIVRNTLPSAQTPSAPASPEGAPLASSASEVDARMKLTMHTVEQRMQITTQALQALAKSLAGYPGRKNLIWFYSPMGLYTKVGMMAVNLEPYVLKAGEVLAEARVATYSIHPGGLSSIRTQPMMDRLAALTGGKAFYNTNDLDVALQKSIEDGSTYYALGYYPENRNWDGKFRKVHVEANRRDVSLRHRNGYYAVDGKSYAQADAKIRERDLADALRFDYPPSTAIQFKATIAPPTSAKTVVNYSVDPHSISFELTNEGLQHAEVGCYVMAFDEKGKPVKMDGRTFATDFKLATYQTVMKDGMPFDASIDLPAGSYLLKLAVRDERTGVIGTANAKVTVPGEPTMPAAAGPEEKKLDNRASRTETPE